jgi:membrane-associated protein
VPDPTPLIHAVLASPWMLPLLTLAVAADGPFPPLPSEPVLFSAAASATADQDLGRLAALFAAAMVGSVLGDLLLYGLGRSSHRIVRPGRRVRNARETDIAARVNRHLHRRPVTVLAAVRLLPGGRLVSVTAAGRARVPFATALAAIAVASVVWTVYMTGIGVVIGPFTGGDPLLSLLVGIGSAAIVGALLEGVRRLLAARQPREAVG